MSRATERRQSWLDVFADYPAPANLALEDVRRNIGVVDECLQDLWNLGENIFLAWTSRGERTLLLALPYYLLAEYVSGARPIKGEPRPEEYIGGLISGSKHLAADELQGVADKLGVAPQSVKLPFRPDDGVGRDLMSALVQRYGLAYTRNRPVLLVDIVGFSLFPAMEQVVLLQSLSHSVNSAYSKLAARNFRINFARSTTGDGFYIWNRADTLEGSAHLYTLMLLMLADNAIAQSKARSRSVPRLRTAFHVGPHYEFYQSEGLSPTRASYLVGEGTITLARRRATGATASIAIASPTSTASGTPCSTPRSISTGRRGTRFFSASAIRRSRPWSSTRLCGRRPCKDVSACFTAGPAGANMQGGERAFRGGGMSTADRIYQRTEAGEKAWESRDPGVPAEQRRILGLINGETHSDLLQNRLRHYSAA